MPNSCMDDLQSAVGSVESLAVSQRLHLHGHVTILAKLSCLRV